MVDLVDLETAIRRKYQSLAKPNFGWVSGAYHEDPARVIREKLASKFDVVDITDLNSDVSIGYELHEPGSGALKCVVRISMVGKYAVLVRNTPDTPADMLVNGVADCRNPSEAFVAMILNEGGTELLDRETLSTPVPLRLFVADPDRVRMYQALFTDTDFLPGEFEAMTIGSETSA